MDERNVVTKDRSQELLLLADEVINQIHYEKMDMLPQCELSQEVKEIRMGDVACLFRISELVFNKEDGSIKGLTTVLSALNSCGAACIMLLQCREGRSELYLGAINKQRYQNLYYLNTIRDILRTGIEGNLPGTQVQEIESREQIERKLSECLDDGFDTQCITAVSCVANQPQSGKKTVGLEKLLGAVGNRNFSILILADPIKSEQMKVIRQGYEELGTQLSELESVSITCQSGTNKTASVNFSETLSESLSSSISHTQSHSSTNGWSKGKSSGETEQDRNPAKMALMAAAGIGVSAVTKNATAGYFAMNVVSSMMGNASTQLGNNESQSGSETGSESDTVSDSRQQGKSYQDGKGYSEGITEGISMQTVTKDKHIQGLLSRLDSYLEWLNRCENYGMFNCCAYVISGSASVNLLVASQYQALMQGEDDMSQPVTVNTWTQSNDVEHIRQSLMHFMHPAVMKGCVEVTPAMLISSKELSIQMALPQEPVVGISVMEYASFGREVVRKSPLPTGKVAKLGTVVHMGKCEQNQPVILDLQSLAAHTFIAGTNGSGKSNAVFKILEELQRSDIPFMVIEPAKGEYKNVFGRDKNVLVYGTNRKKTPLLRLNPFWFNDDVNIKEHIASLMGVFNASWPMYAAMPSVLNAAIENAYRACGWNLNTSRCVGQKIFPTVQDVLSMLKKKMEKTEFSEEVKGNYVGALSTRLESLCSGIYADIFSGADLGDRQLFENNVLIDLSRAGSSEISAMVMGILLIRLREYRMSEGALNHPLRHVTVLEEAHHLLKRTSTVQSEEGSNLMGKAVEMISNAIAEMRSYGDGFIIADQSPGLLDASVLRNTNTKIILRLPEGSDRELVGNTIGLTERQTYELSRLKTGIGVIYQKDWLEAVLCQIDRAAHKEELYLNESETDQEEQRKAALIHYLLNPVTKNENVIMDSADVKELILQSAISGENRKKLISVVKSNHISWMQRLQMIAVLAPIAVEIPFESDSGTMDEWCQEMIETNELDRFLDMQDAKMVVAAHAWQHMKENIMWKKAATSLFSGDETHGIEQIRGDVLALLCGKKHEYESVAEMEEWMSILAVSDDTDRLLSDLLEKYIQNGRIRKRGELKPYSEIAWEYAGGEDVWESAFDFLQRNDIKKWDSIMREKLLQNVFGGRDLQTELLSLVLQRKGSSSLVRGFYYRWLAWAVNAKTDEE